MLRSHFCVLVISNSVIVLDVKKRLLSAIRVIVLVLPGKGWHHSSPFSQLPSWVVTLSRAWRLQHTLQRQNPPLSPSRSPPRKGHATRQALAHRGWSRSVALSWKKGSEKRWKQVFSKIKNGYSLWTMSFYPAMVWVYINNCWDNISVTQGKHYFPLVSWFKDLHF